MHSKIGRRQNLFPNTFCDTVLCFDWKMVAVALYSLTLSLHSVMYCVLLYDFWRVHRQLNRLRHRERKTNWKYIVKELPFQKKSIRMHRIFRKSLKKINPKFIRRQTMHEQNPIFLYANATLYYIMPFTLKLQFWMFLYKYKLHSKWISYIFKALILWLNWNYDCSIVI